MQVETLAFCVQSLEKANRSPMGIALVNRICSVIEYESMEVFCKYKEIKEKLIKNEFASPKEFLNYYDSCIEQIVLTFSPEAEVTFGYLALQEIMHREMAKIIFNAKNSWNKSIDDFQNSISPMLSFVPDSKVEYITSVQSNNAPTFEHKKKKTKFITSETETSKIDYLDLKDKISRLKNDEDVLEISKLVRRCEEGYTLTEKRSIEFDLSNFSQYALGLIKAALSKCEYMSDEEFNTQNQLYENAHKLQAVIVKSPL